MKYGALVCLLHVHPHTHTLLRACRCAHHASVHNRVCRAVGTLINMSAVYVRHRATGRHGQCHTHVILPAAGRLERPRHSSVCVLHLTGARRQSFMDEQTERRVQVSTAWAGRGGGAHLEALPLVRWHSLTQGLPGGHVIPFL